MTAHLGLLVGVALGGFGFGWLVRDILATRPTTRRYEVDLSPAAARGELDLNWDDPRRGFPIVLPPPSCSHVFVKKGAGSGSEERPLSLPDHAAGTTGIDPWSVRV